MVVKGSRGLEGGDVRPADPRERCGCHRGQSLLLCSMMDEDRKPLRRGEQVFISGGWTSFSQTKLAQKKNRQRGKDQKQRWNLEPRKTPGERLDGRLPQSPETDTKGPSHLRDQNRVGPRGRVQRRWTPALSWKKGCGESSRRDRILAQLGSWANPNLP